MKITAVNKITENDKLIVISIFEEENNAKYPKDVGKVVEKQIKEKNFKGEEGEILINYLPRKMLLLGLGKCKEFDATKAREIFASMVKATQKKSTSVTIVARNELKKYGQEIGEGVTFGNHYFAKYKTGKKADETKKNLLSEVRLLGDLDGFEKGISIAEAVNYVRDLVTAPANIATPAYMAREAEKIAKENKYKIKVLDRKKIEKLKMGCLLAVNDGSKDPEQQARLVIMEYYGGDKKEKPIVIVGKGLCFDTGGLNLKPGKAINDMQQDMAGGAAILGLFKLLRQFKIKKNVIGIIPLTENMVDAKCFRPNDILTSYAGKTIEVLSTDAEGRLILVDAISYGIEKFKPEYLIDIATLTGACIVALGDRYAGVMGNDQKLMDEIKKAGDYTDELVWQLPIHKDHKKIMESTVADLRNIEDGFNAAVSTAAAFLENFVEKTKWAHIDIAGTAYARNPKKYESERGSGYGVRLFLRLLENWK